jgi:hypothetical protein
VFCIKLKSTFRHARLTLANVRKVLAGAAAVNAHANFERPEISWQTPKSSRKECGKNVERRRKDSVRRPEAGNQKPNVRPLRVSTIPPGLHAGLSSPTRFAMGSNYQDLPSHIVNNGSERACSPAGSPVPFGEPFT